MKFSLDSIYILYTRYIVDKYIYVVYTIYIHLYIYYLSAHAHRDQDESHDRSQKNWDEDTHLPGRWIFFFVNIKIHVNN